MCDYMHIGIYRVTHYADLVECFVPYRCLEAGTLQGQRPFHELCFSLVKYLTTNQYTQSDCIVNKTGLSHMYVQCHSCHLRNLYLVHIVYACTLYMRKK